MVAMGDDTSGNGPTPSGYQTRPSSGRASRSKPQNQLRASSLPLSRRGSHSVASTGSVMRLAAAPNSGRCRSVRSRMTMSSPRTAPAHLGRSDLSRQRQCHRTRHRLPRGGRSSRGTRRPSAWRHTAAGLRRRPRPRPTCAPGSRGLLTPAAGCGPAGLIGPPWRGRGGRPRLRLRTRMTRSWRSERAGRPGRRPSMRRRRGPRWRRSEAPPGLGSPR